MALGDVTNTATPPAGELTPAHEAVLCKNGKLNDIRRRTVFVEGLPLGIEEASVARWLADCGAIEHIGLDVNDGAARGQPSEAVVVFKDVSAAEAALAMDGHPYDGCSIVVWQDPNLWESELATTEKSAAAAEPARYERIPPAPPPPPEVVEPGEARTKTPLEVAYPGLSEEQLRARNPGFDDLPSWLCGGVMRGKDALDRLERAKDSPDFLDVLRRECREMKKGFAAMDAAAELEKRQKKEATILHMVKQRRKRRCSHCHATVPLTSWALPYCSGCGASVRREDRPRYCSEACQCAHWHAVHRDMCPSAAIQFTTAERFEFDELKWHIDQLAIPLGAERSKLSQAALAKARGA